MTAEQEREFHDIAVRLEELSRGTGWAAMQYAAIGRAMTKLAEYCEPEIPKLDQRIADLERERNTLRTSLTVHELALRGALAEPRW